MLLPRASVRARTGVSVLTSWLAEAPSGSAAPVRGRNERDPRQPTAKPMGGAPAVHVNGIRPAPLEIELFSSVIAVGY